VPDHAFTLNVVWTGTTFSLLHPFVASQLAHSEARFRFVVNGCPADQVEAMERFALGHPDRVVDILTVSERMVGHGVALDRVRARTDDGDHFAMIDPDIKANAPFVGPLARHLVGPCAVATSGTEVWSVDNLVPPGHPGVAGEHFATRDGFTFGSPHFALYRREPLDATCERWSVGFGSAGNALAPEGTARLRQMGLDFWIYDTGKLVNCFLQADGFELVHEDFDHLVHVGGLAHFLAPTGWRTGEDGQRVPDWKDWPGDPRRYQVAEFAARVLQGHVAGGAAPGLPVDADQDTLAKLRFVAAEMADLVSRHPLEV
jgi:hypothetical protein